MFLKMLINIMVKLVLYPQHFLLCQQSLNIDCEQGLIHTYPTNKTYTFSSYCFLLLICIVLDIHCSCVTRQPLILFKLLLVLHLRAAEKTWRKALTAVFHIHYTHS